MRMQFATVVLLALCSSAAAQYRSDSYGSNRSRDSGYGSSYGSTYGSSSGSTYGSSGSRDHFVRPHNRDDGSSVGGHYRTNPNGTTLDNYGTRGNVNPYTGKSGTRPAY